MKLKNAKDIIEKVFGGKYKKVVIYDSDYKTYTTSDELNVTTLKAYKIEQLKKAERYERGYCLYF